MWCGKKTIKELREIVKADNDFVKEQTFKQVRRELFYLKIKIQLLGFLNKINPFR
jgi:hypothetical protein